MLERLGKDNLNLKIFTESFRKFEIFKIFKKSFNIFMILVCFQKLISFVEKVNLLLFLVTVHFSKNTEWLKLSSFH